MNILVAGAGYLGLPLAVSLKEQGHQVSGWVASEDSAGQVRAAGVEAICGDLAQAELWRGRSNLWDTIFYCPSTSGGGTNAYNRVHQLGLANALQSLSPSGRFLYTSSTSVYGQSDGGDVDERSPTEPAVEGSRILLEAEKMVVQKGGTVLRLAGIYGPERCVYLKKLREGRADIPGDGIRWVNQIHRSDALSALQFLWNRREVGEIWNVADNEAVFLRDLYRWLCDETGISMPAAGGDIPLKKRGLTHKRVLNDKLRQAGWSPHYPTFRQGYGELLKSS